MLTLAAIVVATSLMVGCEKGGTRIRGLVTLDGEPVEQAVVQLFPQRQDGGRTAASVTDATGRFEVAATAGTYRVTVMAQRTVGQKRDDANPNNMIDIRELVTPDQYRDAKKSPLTAEAVSGKTTDVEFRLTSGTP